MDKIATLENTPYEKFKEVLIRLLSSMGMLEIKDENLYYTAIEKGTLTDSLNTFIISQEKLSGAVDTDSIMEILDKIQNETRANKIIFFSQHHISKGFEFAISQKHKGSSIVYIGRDQIIPLIDKYQNDFWKHDDIQLLDYEKKFHSSLENENQLKLLKLPNDKYEKLTNIFIQPSLTKEMEDPSTHIYTRKRVNMGDLILEKKNCIIEGISGTGKTTLLQNIGIELIKQNSKESSIIKKNSSEKKNLPVYITSTDILSACRNINRAILVKLNTFFPDTNFKELAIKYNIFVLIDSMDEFDEDDKEKALRHLMANYKSKNIKFYIGTRNLDCSRQYEKQYEIQSYTLSRFNLDQVKRFVSAFLPDNQKVNNLMQSLRENKILERLPMTPLTLSLISILYDEREYEIPATITDIYNNFNDLIVGRSIVSTKGELVDVSFRERILSLYGLKMMENKDHHPLTKEEFSEMFLAFYGGKTLNIKNEDLEELLSYIIHNTGILYVKDDKWVCFSHDSYMEYYAAVEIFKFHRNEEYENKLVENFFDVMWQNVSVFYAGMTKDMDDFAQKINNKLKKSSRIMEYISGIQGAGYLLQALYQTDNSTRKDVILTSLNLVMETNEFFKKMSTMNDTMLRNYRLPIIQIINFFHFYEMFNSLTLKDPIRLAFEELKKELEEILATNKDTNRVPMLGYKLMELAFTMDSKRISDESGLDYILGKEELLKDPNLNALATLSLDLIGKEGYDILRVELKKNSKSLSAVLESMTQSSTSKIRFSVLDTVRPDRRIQIFVEGQTDAMILEHAFMILTDGQSPYWNVRMATQNGKTGSAAAVSFVMESTVNYQYSENIFIGIYDHDKAGLSEYRRLARDYEEIEEDTIKKRKSFNSYLLCIPVPGEMQQYLNARQDFNFFEIEHYFGNKYLISKEMCKSIQHFTGIYEVKDSKKVAFADQISKETDPNIFILFKDLFLKIDQISGETINYII